MHTTITGLLLAALILLALLPQHSSSVEAATLDSTLLAIVSRYEQQGVHTGVSLTGSGVENVAIFAGDSFPAASLYKLFVLWKVQSEIRAGHLSDQTPLLFTPDNDQVAQDGFQLGTYGSSMSVAQARWLMITQSNNTAAWMLRDRVGLNALNAFLAAHGYTSTYRMTTPREMGRFLLGLADHSLDPALVPADYALMLDLLKHQQLITPLSTALPPDVLFAHKTGDLDQVAHDAGLLYTRDGRVLSLVVMTKGDSAAADEVMAAIAGVINTQVLGGSNQQIPAPLQTGLRIPSGGFYRGANGQGGEGRTGYAIMNTVWPGVHPIDARLYDEFLRLGQVDGTGYPASWPFVWNGFVSQVTQKGVLQWRPEAQRIYYVNVFDELHDRGLDERLYRELQVPRMVDWSGDAGKAWNLVVARHMAVFDNFPQMRATYNAAPNPLELYGLPMSPVVDFGPFYAVRLQRAVFQLYKVATPYAHAGDVLVANGGDVAKQMGLVPAQAVVPGDTPVWSYRIMAFSPTPGMTAGQTVQVRGAARDDSGQVNWELRSGAGTVLKQGTIRSAACCSWANFSFDLDLSDIPSQPLKLILFERAPSTGKPLGSVELTLNYVH